MGYAEEIRKFFKGEVSDDAADLAKASKDASLFAITPALVVSPKDPEDVKALVRFVKEKREKKERVSLTGRSAGTDMTGGPLTDSIVVSFTPHFNKIIEIGDGYAVTEPGVYYRDFEKETLAHGLLMPSYPASRELCTVGGMVANNSGGEKTLSYGKTEDYVRSLSVVLADGNEYVIEPLDRAGLEQKKREQTFLGEIYRKLFDLLDANYDALKAAKPNVTKNSAGYYLWNVYDREKGVFDLTKLLVGSQGTLGLHTKITFRLIRPQQYSRLVLVYLKDLGHLAEITNAILGDKPESLESFDDHTFNIAMKFLPAVMKRLNGNLIGLAWGFLPEFLMVIEGGVPKLMLLAEFTGETAAEALAKAETAEKDLARFGVRTKVTETEAEAKKYWVFRRESFNLLRQHVHGLRTAPFIDDFVVRPEFLPKFLPELDAILAEYKIIYTVAGHVGDGNFHIIPLMDMTKDESVRIVRELSDRVYALILKYHGTITGEHNDGLIRSSYLPGLYGEKICALFEETKKIFDPLNIFNPGKKVNADREYAFAHLDRSKA